MIPAAFLRLSSTNVNYFLDLVDNRRLLCYSMATNVDEEAAMKRRRWICTLLLALCVMFFGACSKRSSRSGQTRSGAAPASETIDAPAIALTVASGRYSTGFFTSDKLSIVSAAAADGGAVYLWGRNFQNEVESNWLFRYNPDGTSEECWLSLSAGGYITALDVSAGEVYYLERVDAEDGSAAWFLHTLQAQETLDWAGAGNDLENLVAAGGLAYLTDGSTLYTCSLPDGAIAHSARAETEITTLLCKKNGTIVAYCEDTGNLYELEAGGEVLAKTGTLPLLFRSGKLLPGTNSGYDCLVLGQAELFGWNIDEASAVQLLSFDTYGLVSNNISAFASLGNGVFLGAAWKSGELQDRLFRLEPSEEAAEPGNDRVLKLAGLSRPMVLSTAIADFKALRPEYTVEYTDYAALYGDQALQQLQLDLMQGNAPDLLFVNGLPFAQYGKRGLLENLYAWMDADDSCARTDFTQNLLKALESAEHNLYQMPQSYSIVTTAGLQDLAGSRSDWTYAAVNEALAGSKTLVSAFYGETGEALAVTLPLYMMSTFVDYENAKSHFDSAEAVSFCTFLNNVQPHAQIPYTAENELEALQKGELLFAQLMLLSPEQFAETDELFDGELIYPGYPDAPGGSFYLNLPMAIPAAAQEKDGAWAFLRMLFSSDYYATRGGWIPLQSGFEASIKDALADGASEESLQKLAQLQENIHSAAYYEEAISDILADETSYLFAGARTVEETAVRVDQRVQLYLTEQWG